MAQRCSSPLIHLELTGWSSIWFTNYILQYEFWKIKLAGTCTVGHVLFFSQPLIRSFDWIFCFRKFLRRSACLIVVCSWNRPLFITWQTSLLWCPHSMYIFEIPVLKYKINKLSSKTYSVLHKQHKSLVLSHKYPLVTRYGDFLVQKCACGNWCSSANIINQMSLWEKTHKISIDIFSNLVSSKQTITSRTARWL
jgi:hypothetical protein